MLQTVTQHFVYDVGKRMLENFGLVSNFQVSK